MLGEMSVPEYRRVGISSSRFSISSHDLASNGRTDRCSPFFTPAPLDRPFLLHPPRPLRSSGLGRLRAIILDESAPRLKFSSNVPWEQPSD